MVATGEGGLTWRVELPERSSYGLSSARRPKAVLHLTSEARGDEAIPIPVAVGRGLRRKARDGELSPSSRAELLFDLDSLSRRVAATRVAAMVNRRDYSAGELGDRLREEGYRDAVVEASVAHAVEVGLVDDRRFADAYVRSKVSAGWGMRRIERELARRGVDTSLLPGWPHDYLDPEEEGQRARRAAESHHVSGANQLQKMVRFLVGRGFSTSVAYDAARWALGE